MCDSDTLHLLNEEPISPPYSGNWVFFVDDLPGSHWHHPCRYIFISTSDGAKQEFSKSIYPYGLKTEFDLISHWIRPTPQYDPPTPPVPPTPNPVSYNPNSHLWAVMIVGNDYLCEYEFWNSASQFYTMLKSWGFTEDQIKVHYLEGMGPDNKQSLDSENHVTDDDIDFSAQESSIESTFDYLESILTPDDVLVVYVSSHGNNDDNEDTFFAVPNGTVYDNELANMLEDVNCSSIFFLLNFCFSGGFVDNLADISSASCLNRTIHTACSADEVSAGEWWITLHSNDSISMFEEFPMYWSAAAQGVYPHFEDVPAEEYFHPTPYDHEYWAYNTGSFPFNCYSYDAWNNSNQFHPNPDDDSLHTEYPDKNPDALGNDNETWGNNDGILQLSELFNYANYFDTRSTFGYFNPWRPDDPENPHDPRNSTTPREICTQSDMMNYMTLRGVAGNVSDHDLHFSTDFVVGDHLRLLNGSELTIEDNVHVKILDGASIVVQEGAILNIGENCVINFDGADPAIIVSGEINIAESVQFIKESLTSSTGLFLDSSDSVSMSNVSFENCSLRSENTGLSVVNSTFVNSSITQRSKSLNVSGCSFTNSNINAYQAGTPPRTDQVTVYGSSFSDYNGCAIKVTGYPNYIIERDTLSNVGNSRNSAIEISESGSGGLYSILDNVINDCSNAGIKLYHSYAKISTENQITRCENGIVALRESSWRAGGNTTHPYQILSDNENYELYFSYDSAPESFSTIIIDHGIYNTPYVMCINVPPIHNRVDLSYNCWEGNFIPINDLQPSGLYIYLPYWTPGNKSAVEDSLCKAILVEAIDDIEDGNLNTAKNLLEGLVSTYPDNQYATAALKRLHQIAIMMESDLSVLKSYYQDSAICENSNLSSVAEYLATQCDIGLGNYTQAIMWFEDIIMSPPTVIDSLFAHIDLGYLYMSMPDSTKYQCRYPGYRPTSWAAFEQTKSALLALISGNSYENTDNSNIPAPSVSNFPNPFNPSTTIRFSIPQDSSVKLVVYNVRGQVVKTIVNDTLPKGNHSAFWNGVDDNGCAVSSGVYFYRLQTGNTLLTGKCLLLK